MSDRDTWRDKWYETYYSILFMPPGEVPQTKGPWTDTGYVAESIALMKAQEQAGTLFMVLESRCGDIEAQEADEWLEMRQVYIECAEEDAAYIEAGVCSDCGACSLKDAKGKCRPSPVGDTGDYSCAGERLWEDEEESEEADEEAVR